MTQTTHTSAFSLLACEEGSDPIEDRLRANIRGTIEAVFDEVSIPERNGSVNRWNNPQRAGSGMRLGTCAPR